MSARNGRRLQQALIYLVLVVASIVLVAPVLYVFSSNRN